MDPIHESIPHRHAVTGEEDLMPALITHSALFFQRGGIPRR